MLIIVTQKKTLFLGDSFTVGTGLGEGLEQEAFPFQLTAKLRDGGVDIAAPKMYAVDGDTTKHLLGALNAAEPQSNPDEPNYSAGDYDLVVLSIGINDLFRGHSLEDYQHHFSELLQRAIRFAGDNPSKVMVVSISAWDASPSVHNGGGTNFREEKYAQVRRNMEEISISVDAIQITDEGISISQDTKVVREQIERARNYNTRDGISQAIDEFNEAARSVIEEANKRRGAQNKVAIVDVTQLTRQDATREDGSPDHSLFAEDGIHYSGKMYSSWANHALSTSRKALGANDVSPDVVRDDASEGDRARG